MISVVFIDGNIYGENLNNILYYEVENNRVVQKEMKSVIKRKTHGGICVEIFGNYAANYMIHYINIMKDQRCNTCINKLQTALNWCLEQNIQIISMSVGTINIRDGILIADVTKKIYDRGIVIVAAFHNNQITTYPAVFPWVLGVVYNQSIIEEENQYVYVESVTNQINIIGSCTYNKVETVFQKCNSFTTPFISAIISNMLNNQNADIYKLKCLLKMNAKFTVIDNNHFWKKLILNWNDVINIPVIVVRTNKINATVTVSSYIKYFLQNNYLTIGGIFASEIEKYCPTLYYNIADSSCDIEYKLLEYTNLNCIDIIFIYIENDYFILELYRKGFFDLIIDLEDKENQLLEIRETDCFKAKGRTCESVCAEIIKKFN